MPNFCNFQMYFVNLINYVLQSLKDNDFKEEQLANIEFINWKFFVSKLEVKRCQRRT